MIGPLNCHLPTLRTSLVGRERDVAEVCNLVLRGQERVITLTGVGGCGKTRLALQAAWKLGEAFPDGVWLVELASLSDPLLVPDALASALGITEAPGRELTDALVASLQSRVLLVVLDNCEHLIEACARLVDHLLSACPGLRTLATSREPLQIAGERQWRVPPLAVPDPAQLASPDDIGRFAAVRLFVERASAVESSFRLTAENGPAVARICTLLGGLPLALELAAARVRVLSVEQIAERLDDCFRLLVGSSRSAPSRQQTLRAALDWSYNLLTEPEQVALRRLAVFVGGWGLEAAEAVCADGDLGAAEVLDVLSRLVDKSLVLVEEQAGEARYGLLEPVRQYGMHRLAERGEVEAIGARLAAFYLALAERAEPELHGPRQVDWLQRLDRELDNIRSALRWADERGDNETPLRLAGSLHWYFWMRRHLREGLRWLETALARGVAASPQARAKALTGATMVCSFLGEYRKGLAFGRQALTLNQQLRDDVGQAMNKITLSHISLDQGDLPAARAMGVEALALARESGSPWALGNALIVLGEVVRRQGDAVEAVALYEEALAIFEQQGDGWGVGMVTYALASPLQDTGDFKLPAVVSNVHLYWERGDHVALAGALEYLAGRGEAGPAETQVRLFAAAHALRKSLGAPLPIGERDDVERHLEAARVKLGEARFAAAWAEGCALSLEQVVTSVLSRALATANPTPELPASKSRAPGPSDTLTRREREVAKLVALGYTDRQIAEELTITEGTAGNHVHNILEKLSFRSRVQVVDWALAQGLIDRRPE